MLDLPGFADRQVIAGIRPEGFLPREDGAFACTLRGVEVMGRDISVLSAHPACDSPVIRSIVSAESQIDLAAAQVRFSLKPDKVFVFDAVTEKRIRQGE